MPVLQRPGGIEINWKQVGDGPLVLVLPHWFSDPAVYQGLVDELARDHRVVTYDPRGCGRSSRTGPLELSLDVEDLAGLVEELGGGAVAAGFGDGRDRATRVACSRPELIPAVVECGAASLLAPRTAGDPEGPSASRAVVSAVIEMADRNLRAAICGIFESTNPGMGPDELRARLDAVEAYSSREALVHRLQSWALDDVVEVARRIGDRLWISAWSSDWAPNDVWEGVRELLPEAHMRPVAEGPISRPELTAGVVREAVAAVA